LQTFRRFITIHHFTSANKCLSTSQVRESAMLLLMIVGNL